MICPPCQKAGACNALVNHGSHADISQALAKSKAEELHGACEHPGTCPCQHVIGQVIQEAYR